jgi:hypothetical protein
MAKLIQLKWRSHGFNVMIACNPMRQGTDRVARIATVNARPNCGARGSFPRPIPCHSRSIQSSLSVLSNQFGFTITGTTNIPIVVEASANLATASWTALQTCTLTNGSVYFSDPEWTNYPARFYRIRSP